MRRLSVVMLMALLVSATVAPASAIHGDYTLERIANAYHGAEIDFDEYVMYSVFSIFAPDQLPPEFEGVDLTPQPISGTSILNLAYNSWEDLRVETQDIIAYYLPGGGGSTICGPYDETHPWGYVEYGVETYHFDTPDGNICVWYALQGVHAVDPTDSDSSGFPDVVEWTGADYEYAYWDNIDIRGWASSSDAPQGYLPTKDIFWAADWPGLDEDWGMDLVGVYPTDALDVHMGSMTEWFGAGILGVCVHYLGAWDFPLTDRHDEPAFIFMPKTYTSGSAYPTCETATHEFHHAIQAVSRFLGHLS